MARIATYNRVCMACGADVRSEALFCYNCGVAVNPVPTPGEQPPTIEKAEKSSPVAESPSELNVEAEPRDLKSPSGNAENGPLPLPDRKPLTPAMLKRKRASNRQPVEVAWEAPSQPSIVFAAISVALTIFVILILAAAMYLK